MAKVRGQNIPAEIEESFTKLLTKQHKEHTFKQGSKFGTFKFGESKVFGEVATSEKCLFGTFKFGQNILFGQSPQEYTCNKRTSFKKPPWQGFIVDPPTPRQSVVRHAFKKSVNCWNKLTNDQKYELWQKFTAAGGMGGYYNYWHSIADPYFYYDIKHPWCPDPGQTYINWTHSYYRNSGVIEASNFDTGWNDVSGAWKAAEEIECPDPAMGHHTGMIFVVQYNTITKKYYLALYGIRGEGTVRITNMNTGGMGEGHTCKYLLGKVRLIEYPHITHHENGILWIPEPNDEQIADQDLFWWDGGNWVKGKSFSPGACPWGKESYDTDFPWTEKTMKIGTLKGNYGLTDLKFEVKNSYYTPNSVKGPPPTTNDTYVYGGMGEKLIFSIGWSDDYWGKAGPYH